MHLFYQQGLFSDEAPEETVSPWPSEASQRFHDRHFDSSNSLVSEAGYSDSSALPNKQKQIRLLQARIAELEAKLQAGALRSENEALESKVLKAQEDFIALQTEFKDMKEQCGEKLDSLRLALEEQQSAADHADRRVVCSEDLVRYHQEQRRLMAGHWKSQCQQKDERIRYLNLQLTEYTIDWQNLGGQRPTEASLSHEHHCLQDRQFHLRKYCETRKEAADRLRKLLESSEAEEERFASNEAELEAKVTGVEASLLKSKARRDGLQARLDLIEKEREHCEASEVVTKPPASHQCIWHDELDVREAQLSKISSQLEKTRIALDNAQQALAEQREKHQEMKGEHAEAEAELQEGERRRLQRQRRCQDLRRAETGMSRLLEAAEGGARARSSTAGAFAPMSRR